MREWLGGGGGMGGMGCNLRFDHSNQSSYGRQLRVNETCLAVFILVSKIPDHKIQTFELSLNKPRGSIPSR